jgi:4-hydroxy-tetrahydrodipicolinate synthase
MTITITITITMKLAWDSHHYNSAGGMDMYKGVFSPIVTIFDQKGDIDYKANERVINNLIDNGIDGILFLGSMGEFFAIPLDKKKEYIDFAVKMVDKRVKVLIGTGGTDVDEVAGLTRYSQLAGADAALVVSPYYFKLDDESLYRYFAQVAASADIDIILYNFPDRTSVSLDAPLVTRLARDFKNIVGIKDTVDNISHTRKLIKAVRQEFNEFSILAGFDEYLVPNLMAGGDGVICGLTNIAPRIFSEIYAAYGRKDLDTVDALQKKIYTLMQLYDVTQPFVGAIKAATSIVLGGGISMQVAKPAKAADELQLERIRKILGEAGLI